MRATLFHQIAVSRDHSHGQTAHVVQIDGSMREVVNALHNFTEQEPWSSRSSHSALLMRPVSTNLTSQVPPGANTL
jgi:hypothetical protein